MNTPWTSETDKNCPLPEYPRPQLVRENWVNLNGQWDYAITDAADEPESYDGSITVPFSPETELSGVGRTLEADEYLWYHRDIFMPESFSGRRVILHFGAVDRIADVWVNGVHAAHHVGGYLPFEADITDSITDGKASVLVRVSDDTDKSYHTRGKQSNSRGGIWYTPQSGIWQTVWMEAVPESHINKLRITPDYDRACVNISAETVGDESAYVDFNGESYALPAAIPVPDFEPWSPEYPKLYDFTVKCGEDKVKSYFAMRKFSVEKDEKGIMRLCLNGRPYFHNGLLDQGYWSDGLYTAPTDEALIYDIEMAKKMGFNTLRKHIKVEPLRWYYHCDRLGMLVWQDMPSGGGKYNPAVISSPVVLPVKLSDSRYALFARKDEEGRREFVSELREMIAHLYNCPCIALWVPFNEGWGQFDAAKVYNIVRDMDATRTVDHASGWYDQGVSDVRSDHVYFRKYRFKADKLGRAVLLSEFGGYNHRVQGHAYNEKDFGYKKFESVPALETALEDLYQNQIRPAVAQGLSAAIYTQLTDVEDELNGLLTFDRKVCKIEPEKVRKIINID